MTHTSPDYHMLVGLRKHLIVVSEATKQLTNARHRMKDLENTLYEVKHTNKHFGKAPEYGSWVRTEKWRYESAKNAKAEHSMKFWFTLITIIGVLIAVALPIVLWLKTKLGYDFYMSHIWEGIIPKYDGAVNVYCYILGTCVAVTIILAVLGFSLEDTSESFLIPFTISFIATILFDYVFAFVALGQMWNVHGGWWLLAWIPAILLAILLPITYILKILVAVLVSLVVLILLFSIPIGLIFMWKSSSSVKWRIRRRTLNEAEERDFYQTKAYRLASEKDKLEDPIKRQEYLDKVSILRQGLEKQYTTLIAAERSLISMLETAISKSNAAIAKCPINNIYKNLPDVSALLYYFELSMADTFKEAANLMRNDLIMKNLINLLQKQHKEVMGGINTIIIGLDKLDHATRTLANQWNAFAKQSERQHVELMNGMNRMSAQQERLSEHTRQAIREAEKSMSRNLSDLKTTYIASSESAANKIAGGISSASNEISNWLRTLSY